MSRSNHIAAKLIAEFIGTFALVFIGAGAAAVVGSGAGLAGIGAIALAHGLTVMAFAFAYGPVSGAHLNPAVTFGVLVAGAMGLAEALGYIIVQVVGGIAAAFALAAVLGGNVSGLGAPALAHELMLGATSVTVTPVAGFAIEATLAFFLVTVVLSTAVAGRAGNLAPLAIGMTLTLNIIMGGALTGAAFNPARALGPMIAAGNLDHLSIYLLAPMIGAAIAAVIHGALMQLVVERPRAAVVAPRQR